MTGLDSSAAYSLLQLKQVAQQQRFAIVLTDLSSPLQKQLTRMGVIDDVIDGVIDTDATEGQGGYRIFPTQSMGLAWCEDQILQQGITRRGRYVPLLLRLKRDLPNPDWASTLMDHMTLLHLEAGSYLLRQGQPYTGLYFVETGQVHSLLDPSAPQPIQTFGPGTLIGERGFYQPTPWAVSLVAAQSSQIFFLSMPQFENIRATHPSLAYALYQMVGQLLL
ncbi:MAG: cyclic nucleotide-binding domain-containing protein [Cyanobacteria bacterium J06632_22]